MQDNLCLRPPFARLGLYAFASSGESVNERDRTEWRFSTDGDIDAPCGLRQGLFRSSSSFRPGWKAAGVVIGIDHTKKGPELFEVKGFT